MRTIVVAGDPIVAHQFALDVAPHTSSFAFSFLDSGEYEFEPSEHLNLFDPENDQGVRPEALFVLGCRDDGMLETALIESINEFQESGCPIFVNGVFVTSTYLGSLVGTTMPLFSIAYVPGFTQVDRGFEVAPALQTESGQIEEGLEILRELLPVEPDVVEDRVALLSLRIVSMIINEAAFAVMENVASPEDIDTAMKLGTNYPDGPLEWVDRIGAATIVDVLNGLYSEYGEERYRPCVLLKQYARAGRRFIQS